MEDGWEVSFGTDLVFYLEDRFLLRLSAFENQRETHADRGLADGFNRSGRVSLGFIAHFLGGLDAPGLVASVRVPPRWDRGFQ